MNISIPPHVRPVKYMHQWCNMEVYTVPPCMEGLSTSDVPNIKSSPVFDITGSSAPHTPLCPLTKSILIKCHHDLVVVSSHLVEQLSQNPISIINLKNKIYTNDDQIWHFSKPSPVKVFNTQHWVMHQIQMNYKTKAGHFRQIHGLSEPKTGSFKVPWTDDHQIDSEYFRDSEVLKKKSCR